MRKVDITPLFDACGIDTGHLEIIETDGMYPYKYIVEDNWAYFTAIGCKRLKQLFGQEGKKIAHIGIVGICSGVEGIAIAHIFGNDIERMIVTDVDQEILNGTIQNIRGATKGFNFKLDAEVGLYCEPIEKIGELVDFVHANIPNLPTSGDEDLSRGDEKGSFAPENYYAGYNPPQEFVAWALPAQYAYLQSAKKILKPGGSIIAEVGGRMPYNILEKLFNTCGLELQELVVGFKEQTEAKINFEGYHKNEKEYGVAFEYYRYDEAKNLMKEHGIDNPTYKVAGKELKRLLKPFILSAGEALELYTQGARIGHVVHLLRGVSK